MFHEKGYILNVPTEKTEPCTLEKINWYGNFQDFGTRQLATCFYVPSKNPGVHEEKILKISDTTKAKTRKFKIALKGSDYAQFTLEINNAYRNFDFYYNNTDLVFDRFSRVLQQSPVSVEEMDNVIEKVCNNWLDEHKIFSVRAKLESSWDVPNPDRLVEIN